MFDGNFGFGKVIDPVGRDDFFANYYEKQCLRVHRQDPGYYAQILSVDRLDEYLTSANPKWPDLMLVNAQKNIHKREYTMGGNAIDVPRLYQCFQDGATMVLPQLHQAIPELAALCRAAEREFHAPFQTNIYLSPPNVQGFKIHYDTHDVFVLQIEGKKDWHIYDTPMELPLIGQKFDRNHYTAVPPTEEFTLEAGDLYYCPRGTVHDATSTDTVSLHITFGLMAQTWADFMLNVVSAVCLKDPAFRENMPVGYADDRFDRAPAKEKLRELLRKITEQADLDMVLDEFAQRFISTRKPQLRGQMSAVLEAELLTADAVVVPRANLITRMVHEDERVILVHFNNHISFPEHTAVSLEAVLAAENGVRIRDIPGQLDEDGLLVLARRLLREGILMQAPTGD